MELTIHSIGGLGDILLGFNPKGRLQKEGGGSDTFDALGNMVAQE